MIDEKDIPNKVEEANQQEASQKQSTSQESLSSDLINIVWEAHNFEIKNLWQRSILLVPLIVMAYTAMGFLEFQIIECFKFKTDKCFCLVILLIFAELVCITGIILSSFWVALAKGSKFIQESHEKHLRDILKRDNKLTLYCELSENSEKDTCFFSLSSYRFSPSKINIALGCFSALIFISVGIINPLIICLKFIPWHWTIGIMVGVIGVIVAVANRIGRFFMKKCKGSNKASQHNALKNEQNMLENHSNKGDSQ